MLKYKINGKLHFLKETINEIHTPSIKNIEKIQCDLNNNITNNLTDYFENIPFHGYAIPSETSIGGDVWSKFDNVQKNPRIIVGYQMKNYYSEPTKLNKSEVDEEILKMQQIIKKLISENPSNITNYKFYYVIVCPCYGEEFKSQYFMKNNSIQIGNYQDDICPLMIEEKDYVEYHCDQLEPEIYNILTTILLTENVVKALTGKVFIKSQKNPKGTEDMLLSLLSQI